MESASVNPDHTIDIAESFEHALALLFANSWQQELGRYRSSLAFRGLPSTKYDLMTSLMRLGGPYSTLENHLIRNFQKYAVGESRANYSQWKWLTIGQHHGLPTRLLDWTYSPLVALHFATHQREQLSNDGCVWCVDYVNCHQFLPPRLARELKNVGAFSFTVGMLEEAAKSLDDFDLMDSEPFALFFEPPSLDDRIVNQYALFSVLSSSTVRLDSWLEQRPHLYRKVILPSKIKREVRDKLDQCNINERVLFPGLDGLATWLQRHYGPGEHESSLCGAPDDSGATQ